PEPNTTGIGLKELKQAVGQKLQRTGHGSAAQLANDLDLLYRMNNHALEFLLFDSDISSGLLVWHNRTVQAFFAAYWAVRYASPREDLPRMQRWIVDREGKRLSGFDEFWQFAAEMPDRALRTGSKLNMKDLQRWLALFQSSYTPPAELTGQHDWVQWHRR